MVITMVWQLDMQAVRQMIATILSLPNEKVIDANEEIALSESTDFISVFIAYQDELGAQKSYHGTDEREQLDVVNELTLSVNAYGEEAYSMINKLVASMRLTPVYQLQRKIGLGYLRPSQVKNFPKSISGEPQPRAQVDLIFSINNVIQADVKCGESVQIKTEAN